MKILAIAGALVAAVALLLGTAGADDSNGLYGRVSASPDGIGKTYSGREIARVMGWQGAGWLERPEREQEERSDLLLPLLGVHAGMVVADVGAGSGYYTERIARAVGPSGIAYGVDVQPEMIALIRERARQSGLENIRPVLADLKSVKLPAESVDLAILVDVYHELEYPYEVLASIVDTLKPEGRVAFVEFRAEDPQVPIKPLHKMSEAQIRAEASRQRLAWVGTLETLPWQHVVVFRKLAQQRGSKQRDAN
jgi:SAM-dependent methyltransferase